MTIYGLSFFYTSAVAVLLAQASAPPIPTDMSTVLIQHYGPIAFGLVAVLILWKTIVQPTLDRNRTDVESFKAVVAQMHAVAIATQDTVKRLEAVASTLEHHSEK